MNTDTYTSGRPAVVSGKSDTTDGSYVDWAAIVAGGVIATALSLLLLGFGAGLGLSLTSPYQGEGVSAAWVAIAAGIWLAWVMVTGFGAGGYVAGRMRRKAGDATADEIEARDGMHGLVVWGTGLLVGALLAAMGVGSLLTAGGTVVGKAAEVATDAASSDYFASLMLRGGRSDAAPAPDQTREGTAADPTQTPTPAPAAQPARTTTMDSVNPSTQAQVAAIIGRSLTSGDMAERDIDYLAQVVAANSDMDATAARARVDEVNSEIAQARADTLAAVEKARIAGIVFGFIAAATLLLGAVSAFFAAAAGGRHRDAGLGFDINASRR
ncbi:MAG: hypothetical protein ACK4RZ_11580 [Paracoccaceae bacterium]